jgi:hypothetical protein
MKRKCDACGEELKGGFSLGGTLLCRVCRADVTAEIDATRAAGKQVNAMGIARRMYREKNDTLNYNFRDIPEAMMQELREAACREKCTVRDIMLVAISQWLAKNAGKKI